MIDSSSVASIDELIELGGEEDAFVLFFTNKAPRPDQIYYPPTKAHSKQHRQLLHVRYSARCACLWWCVNRYREHSFLPLASTGRSSGLFSNWQQSLCPIILSILAS